MLHCSYYSLTSYSVLVSYYGCLGVNCQSVPSALLTPTKMCLAQEHNNSLPQSKWDLNPQPSDHKSTHSPSKLWFPFVFFRSQICYICCNILPNKQYDENDCPVLILRNSDWGHSAPAQLHNLSEINTFVPMEARVCVLVTNKLNSNWKTVFHNFTEKPLSKKQTLQFDT